MSTQPVLFPAPYLNPITQNNVVTPIWAKWFGQVYTQTGGSSSTSLSSLITTVETLSTTVATQSTQVTTLQSQVNGLSVGPIL